MGIAQQIANPTVGVPETLSPADAAKMLGVTEADVIASLEGGDLKERKSAHSGASRGPRSRNSCNNQLSDGAKLF